MSQKRPRITWNPACDKTYLEACLHELTTNGREGSSLKSSSWKVVGEKLKSEHGFIAEQKQMRNHYDYLKGKYAVWVRLKNKTGNIYDPITNSFNMTDKEWAAEAKTSKYVDKLRNAPLLYPDLCTALFDGATGLHSWGPSSTQPHPAEEFVPQDFDDVQCTQTEIHSPPPPTNPIGASEESSAHTKKKAKRKGKESSVNAVDATLVKVGQEIIKLARMLVEKNTHSEIPPPPPPPPPPNPVDDDLKACMAKLETLGWGEFDARYNTALLLFSESAHIMKVWLTVPPSSCEIWVKTAGRKYGLLG